MREILAAVLLMVGVGLMFVAALGVLRMPDVYMRLSAAAKATTLGLAAVMAGTALVFGEIGMSSRSLAIVLFIALTTPVAGHLIGRAAYRSRAPLWKGTRIDELRGHDDHDLVPHDRPARADTPSTQDEQAPEE